MDSLTILSPSPLMNQAGWSTQKHSIIGNPQYIYSATALITAEKGRPLFTLQTIRRRSTSRTQDMSRLGHLISLSTGVPLQRKRDSLGKGQKYIPILNKNNHRQDRIPYSEITITPHTSFPQHSTSLIYYSKCLKVGRSGVHNVSSPITYRYSTYG